MSKHRAGDRRIISISIPEDIALRLDKKVGKGKHGRSATISRMIEESLSPTITTTSVRTTPLVTWNLYLAKSELNLILWAN